MAQLIFRRVELEAIVTEAQLQELNNLVEIQNTTDKNTPSKYMFNMAEGIYDITIDDDYNVIVEDITDSLSIIMGDVK